MLTINLCIVLLVVRAKGFLEDNFLLVFDVEQPTSLRQVSLDGKQQNVIVMEQSSKGPDNTFRYPMFMSLRPDGKAVFVKYFASKQFAVIDWANNEVQEKSFTVDHPFAVSGFSFSLNSSNFYITHFGRTWITKMDLEKLTNISTKEFNDPNKFNYVAPFAYDDHLWIMANTLVRGESSMSKYSITSEDISQVSTFDREFNLIRIDWADQKVYFVFLNNIYFGNLPYPQPELFSTIERYIEDMAIGDKYIYLILSMKEHVYRIRKSSKKMETMKISGDAFKRPRNLAVYQKKITSNS